MGSSWYPDLAACTLVFKWVVQQSNTCVKLFEVTQVACRQVFFRGATTAETCARHTSMAVLRV